MNAVMKQGVTPVFGTPNAPIGEMSVLARSVYGECKWYPACDRSRAYAEALGTKTLTDRALRCAIEMGFRIVLETDQTLRRLLGGE